MKKILVLLGGALMLAYTPASAQSASRGPRCGFQTLKEKMIAKDPTWAAKFEAQKAAMQGIADNYKLMQQSGVAAKTSSSRSAVPIIFHIIVDSAQFYALGGTTGIIKRCDSQIAVLNRDYNRHNPDSTSIPSSWKPLYGTPGVTFGLARIDPSGNCSPGYEVKIISGSSTTDAGYDVLSETIEDEKTASTGLAAWDNTKYYNVWCVNFTGSSNSLLGLTEPKSFGSGAYQGVDILYSTLGCTAYDGTVPSGTGSWPMPYNLGRTLTHETGHFFEIWHPWGDDGGLCPWNGGSDDGLSDTPPESDAVYGNPTYTISGGTSNDGCQFNGATNTQPKGIACLSYMDYTDDDAMHMFTTDEAAVIASMVLVAPGGSGTTAGEGTVGENYSLTQNPSLTIPCAPAAVAVVPETSADLNIFPNPTTGQVTITLNSSAVTVKQITVINLLGQEVMTINGQNKDFYSLDLSGMSKGIYFVKCNLASGDIITKKVLLQ